MIGDVTSLFFGSSNATLQSSENKKGDLFSNNLQRGLAIFEKSYESPVETGMPEEALDYFD